MCPALASPESCSDSFFQVNDDVSKTLDASVSDLKVTLVSGDSVWLCSVGDETVSVFVCICECVCACVHACVCI